MVQNLDNNIAAQQKLDKLELNSALHSKEAIHICTSMYATILTATAMTLLILLSKPVFGLYLINA